MLKEAVGVPSEEILKPAKMSLCTVPEIEASVNVKLTRQSLVLGVL